MNVPKRILYVGSLEKESNSRKRFVSLQQMGYEVEGVDVDPFIFVPFWLRIHYHLFWGPGIAMLNKKVIEKAIQFQPDILWVDNKPYLKASTLKILKSKFPDISLANIITDDPCGKFAYCWRRVYHTFKEYDIQFVQREVNVSELMSLGSKRVEICYRSFDPSFHRPIPAIQQERNQAKPVVGFIGSYEKDREEFIAYLVQNGIPVEITGNDWPKGKYWHILKDHYHGPSVYGEAYVQVINRMDIALHFLRKANRDQQDSRTFEIPACGVFMLSERSHLHQQLFEEGKEADYFSTKEELLQKVIYYLKEREKRLELAQGALSRSYESGYDHKSRLNYVIERIYGQPVKPAVLNRVVMSIYFDPEFYPPTINAILNLASICKELVVVTRNQSKDEFPFPSNVKIVKTGAFVSLLDSEKKSTLSKVVSFISFTCINWKYASSVKTDWVVYYDAIPLLAFYLTRFFIGKEKKHWYHNHDMPGTHPVRKFSIGWLALRLEHKSMRKINLFSLPSKDRLQFYPHWKENNNFFFLPNFPSLSVYRKYWPKSLHANKINLIFQGTASKSNFLESVLSILGNTINERSLQLRIKGSIRPIYQSQLIQLAKDRKVEDRVEWCGRGPYRELPEFTMQGDIGLALYKETTIGKATIVTASNKIYEYAASGLPVIVLDNEQFRKYLSVYEWVFFSDGSPDSLKKCVESIAQNYSHFSAAARKSFETSLNFEKHFEAVGKILTEK